MRLRTNATQRGAACVVGLIMLVLITIMLITALNLGTSSFRSVGNMQFRNEAIAAAKSRSRSDSVPDFTEPPAMSSSNVNVGANEYPGRGDPDLRRCRTGIHRPKEQCQARSPPCRLHRSGARPGTSGAVVNDEQTGASVEVHAGSRVQLEDSDKQQSCPEGCDVAGENDEKS